MCEKGLAYKYEVERLCASHDKTKDMNMLKTNKQRKGIT
jgi:hypothetical protein